MWELEIETKFSNLVDILKSQNIYIFSAVFFPMVFCIIAELIQQIKRKNELVKQDFEYLKVLLNAIPEAIVFLDEKQKVKFQNDQFRTLFNDYRKVTSQPSINNLFARIDYIQKEISIDSTISDEHPFMMSFKLAKFNNNKNYFISFKDLKNLKDKEKIIEDQKNQMIEKNKLASLGEMAAGIAHEVNNPLTVIHSNNNMITRLLNKEELNKEQCLKLLLKTTSQIERITKILTSLRSLSRGLAGDEKENFSIDQVIDESISLAKIRTSSKRVKFIFEEKNLKVYANRGQIVQVILNLFNNAIDAIENNPTNAWINVELKARGHYVDIFISDSGKGISPEIVSKIFLPMYTTKEIGKGTGLGLSLSRNFIEQNSGNLDYISNMGNTCFKISLIKSSAATQNAA